ncbi:MAG: RNA 2',3'-cyclic phosphodiesterase [Ignavibacteriae bacterium]|nr:RNA 2',3'-cyclic phosphodiesterase [Ignavibacteriota bacterium]
MTNRLFVAYDLPNETLEFITNKRDELYSLPNSVNWEPDEKLHITSKFLGDVGDYLTELIIDRFENLELHSVKCEFSQFNYFKKNGEMKILYAGIKQNDELSKNQNIIENECGLLGFEKEIRNFKPHLTILRIKGNEDLEKLYKFANFEIEHSFIINSVSLVKSELKPSGSEYTILKSFKMK